MAIMASDSVVDLQEATVLVELIACQAEKHPFDPAISGGSQGSLTYSQLYDLLRSITGQLQSLSLGGGDRIAVVLPNGPLMATAFLSIAASATCAPLNPTYKDSEFEFYLSDLNAKALVVLENSESPAIGVAGALGIPVLRLVPRAGDGAGAFDLRSETDSVLSAASSAHCAWAEPEDIGLVLHTSGTTARPKIVPLTQTNLCTSGRNVARTLGLTSGDCCLNIMPLFHIHGLVGALLSSLSAGASVYCTPGFSGPHVLDWLRDIQPTWYTAVPTMHQAILARAAADRVTSKDLGVKLRLVRSSSAALPPQVMASLEDLFEAPVLEAYGMTEAAHQMACNPRPPAARKPGAVGLAAGPEVAIMNLRGEFCVQGETGEVVIRGANVTPGYDNNPEANASAFTNGWFRTGDQGYLDPDGYLFLTGRLKELINRGGEKISPREIDEVLLDHPAVDQAVSFAAPDERLGEEVMAAVVLKPEYRDRESKRMERDLREFAAGRLADFKVPARILFVDEVPKGPTGKVQRIGLAKVLRITDLRSSNSASQSLVSSSAELSDLELLTLNLCKEVLNRDEINIHDNFFLMGGDSLIAARLMARLEQTQDVKLSLVRLFETPTIAGLAQAVLEAREERQNGVANSAEEELERLLAQMELLSEDEAEALLHKSTTL